MAILVLAEHTNTALNDATAKAVNAATAMGSDVHVLVAGSNAKAAADAAAQIAGVAKVLLADDAGLANALAENVAALLVSLAPGYDAIVAPATANGKNILPRAAALLDVQVISAVTKVISADTFERPIYAGNAIQTVKSKDAKKLLTIQPASFQAAGAGGSASVESVAAPAASGSAKFISEEVSKSDRPELASGEVPVMVGLRLFLPESWTSDSARLSQAGVPEGLRGYRTKPEIALAEIDRVRAAGARFGCVLADAGYGLSGPFRQGLSERGLVWAVGIPFKQKVYRADVTMVFPVAGRGRPRKRHVPDTVSISAQAMLEDAPWRMLSWRRATSAGRGGLADRRASLEWRA